ncbi:hypothetical protein, partial [Mesorhizobium sp. LNJC384A00]|uniref:hypothetical protein n=2 Tax=unclassified Mesorhizobium TaxID=325217 RepID=UPI001AEBDB8B
GGSVAGAGAGVEGDGVPLVWASAGEVRAMKTAVAAVVLCGNLMACSISAFAWKAKLELDLIVPRRGSGHGEVTGHAPV